MLIFLNAHNQSAVEIGIRDKLCFCSCVKLRGAYFAEFPLKYITWSIASLDKESASQVLFSSQTSLYFLC